MLSQWPVEGDHGPAHQFLYNDGRRVYGDDKTLVRDSHQCGDTSNSRGAINIASDPESPTSAGTVADLNALQHHGPNGQRGLAGNANGVGFRDNSTRAGRRGQHRDGTIDWEHHTDPPPLRTDEVLLVLR